MMFCTTRRLSAAVLLIVALSSGCATLFRGSKQSIKVVTDPPGATLTVNGKAYTTPTTVTLKRNKTHDIILTKDGYQGFHFKMKANWDAGGAGAIAADAIIPGGSVLFIIDTIVGADRRFEEIATITMPRATSATPQPIMVYQHKGQLMTKADYDAIVQRDKSLGKKKIETTTPAAPAVSSAE
jgi:hypothetical protein